MLTLKIITLPIGMNETMMNTDKNFLYFQDGVPWWDTLFDELANKHVGSHDEKITLLATELEQYNAKIGFNKKNKLILRFDSQEDKLAFLLRWS